MPSALTILDYTDRELLHLVEDLADSDGYTDAAVIAETIKIPNPPNNPHYARHCVGTRFSWMGRFGWLERHPEERSKWRVTQVGRQLMTGNLTKTAERAFNSMKAGDRVLLTRMLARASITDIPEARKMVTREWQHGMARRRNGR